MTDKQPKALVLAELLEIYGSTDLARQGATELRRLHADNEQLAEFVIAVGGFWGHSRSKLVGEDSLAECINRGDNDEALLRRALSAMNKVLSGADFDHPYAELKQVAAAFKERLNGLR